MRVQFGCVDWGGEFDEADSFLRLQVPEDGAPVLGRGEEVAAAAGPAAVERLDCAYAGCLKGCT